MKYLKRPTQVMLADRYKVQNGKQFKALDKVWKQLLKEQKESGTINRMYAPLSILRNLMLGRSMYTGFTPHLRPNNLANGRGFMDGFSGALMNLANALTTKNSINPLQNACHRMILSIHHWPRVGELDSIFPNRLELDCSPYVDNYISRVQKMIVRMNKDGTNFQGSTYNDLFDEFDKIEQYNLIHESEFAEIKESPEQLSSLLTRFANEWIKIEPKMKESRLQSVKLMDDYPNWMFTDSDGVDHRVQKDSSAQMVITTVPKYSSNRIDGRFYLPVSHLWKLDWLQEYER